MGGTAKIHGLTFFRLTKSEKRVTNLELSVVLLVLQLIIPRKYNTFALLYRKALFAGTINYNNQ